MKDRSNNLSHHERTLLPQSYISLPWALWSRYQDANPVPTSPLSQCVIRLVRSSLASVCIVSYILLYRIVSYRPVSVWSSVDAVHIRADGAGADLHGAGGRRGAGRGRPCAVRGARPAVGGPRIQSVIHRHTDTQPGS